MSLGAVNRALRPHALVFRRLLLTIAAVGAILVGLLAMHSFNTDASHHGAAIAAATEVHDHEHEEASSVAHDDCDGACEPGHSTAVTACLLALMVLTLLLAARELPVRGGLLLRLAPVLVGWAAQVRSLPGPQAPSLEALSISRT